MEVWVFIPIAEIGDYECSNLGNIRHDNKQLKTYIHKNGYVYISLRGKNYPLHYLVALCHVSGNSKLIPHHKDSIRDNNKADNLEWITWKENNNSKNKIGNCRHNCKINMEIANQIRQYNEINVVTYSELSKIFGISTSAIGAIIRNQAWV